MIHVNIRSTYTDALDSEQNFTRTWRWLFNIMNFDHPWGCHHCLFHVVLAPFL